MPRKLNRFTLQDATDFSFVTRIKFMDIDDLNLSYSFFRELEKREQMDIDNTASRSPDKRIKEYGLAIVKPTKDIDKSVNPNIMYEVKKNEYVVAIVAFAQSDPNSHISTTKIFLPCPPWCSGVGGD